MCHARAAPHTKRVAYGRRWWAAYGRITFVVSVFRKQTIPLVVWWMRCRRFCFTIVFVYTNRHVVCLKIINVCGAFFASIQNSLPISLRRTPQKIATVHRINKIEMLVALLNGAICLRWFGPLRDSRLARICELHRVIRALTHALIGRIEHLMPNVRIHYLSESIATRHFAR